jgi:uncharacterized membrane protein YvbJ
MMALVICCECGAKISQYAEQCPTCGVSCTPMSDEQYAAQMTHAKAARRHDLKWWAIAAGCFVLYVIVFGPENARRAEEQEKVDTRAWKQDQEKKEQEQRQKDAWRAFNR